MKKGLKKILAALAAGAMLLSMNMSAFALEYNASTTYTEGNTATVNVTGVKAGANDQVAFLAENGNEIIYIDQKTADASGAVTDFNFTIDFDDAKATPTIKVGSTSTAAGAAKSIKLEGKTINVKPNDEEYGQVAIDSSTVYGNSFLVYVAPYSDYYATGNYTINDEFKNGTVTNEGAISINIADLEATGAIIEIEFEKLYVANEAYISNVVVKELEDERGFTVIGTASGATDFGALLAVDDGDSFDDELLITNGEIGNYNAFTKNIKKFAAMASNAKGQFSVTVTDNGNDGEYIHLPNGKYVVAGYAAAAYEVENVAKDGSTWIELN